MDLSEKLKAIRLAEGLGRTLFSREIDIKMRTLEGIELRHSVPSGDILQAVCSRYPQYTLWLMTGQTNPEAGQVCPEMEQVRRASNSK